MRKSLFCAILLALFSIQVQAQTNAATQDYINKYKDIAIAEMIRTGVPASITLAQGILESASGQSRLTQNSNNHFGIKCKAEWTGDTFFMDDDTKNECFRVYQTPEESFRDHSDFLRNRPYYTALFDLDPTDYKGWAEGLKKAGYATDRQYAKNLINLIEQNHLEDYSDIALNKMGGNNNNNIGWAANQSANGNTTNVFYAAHRNNVQPQQRPSEEEDNRNEAAYAASNNTVNKDVSTPSASAVAHYPNGVFLINQTKVIYAESGTSLFALAANHNISYSRLLEYNDLDGKVDILSRGRLVYLDKKPKKGYNEYHIVVSGENLDDVAQKEGMQLQSLAQFNHINKYAYPASGEKLYLQTIAPAAPRVLSAPVAVR